MTNVIDLTNISQTYDGGESYIIKDLNLSIEDKENEGQFVALLGPSGSGKSTILRYISGLQKPSAGEINLFGKPRKEEDRVGMVFQKYSSLPWLTVLDNIALGLKLKGVSRKERRAQANDMLERCGLAGHGNKFAQYPALSGGQLQRVAIARSLIANPNILLMDEPFGALDVRTRLQMQDSVLDIHHNLSNSDRDPTILFVTHDIDEAVYLASDIYILGKAPANIHKHIKVNLPKDRDRFVKKEKVFQDIVSEIEDTMMDLG